MVNGFTFIECQSWDNFHEGTQLIEAVERYRQRFGFYPKVILADKAYRNRDNLHFCKKHGIRLSGPRLGRPPKDESLADQEQAYKDGCQRNRIEGRNGVAKRRYGLDLIMAILPETAMTEAALNVLAMNVAHLLRALLHFFWKNVCKLLVLSSLRLYNNLNPYITFSVGPTIGRSRETCPIREASR